MILRISASAAIFEEGKLLLCKRSSGECLFPGSWTFPGGKREDGELLEDTVKREVKEETGLDFTAGRKLGKYYLLFETLMDMSRPILARKSSFIRKYDLSSIDGLRNISHVYLGAHEGILNPNSEVEEFRWCDYDEAIKLNLAFAYRLAVEDLRLENIF